MNTEENNALNIPMMTKFKLAIIGSSVLVIGLISSVFLFTLSVIMFPFVAVKLWFLRKKLNEQYQPQGSDFNKRTKTDNTSQGRVFDGECVEE